MKLLLKNIAMLLQIRPLTTKKVSGPQMKELPQPRKCVVIARG